MKDVLTIKKTEQKKLYVAGRISNVKLGQPTDIGGGDMLVPLDFRTPVQLVKLGQILATATGTEFDAELAEKAKAK